MLFGVSFLISFCISLLSREVYSPGWAWSSVIPAQAPDMWVRKALWTRIFQPPAVQVAPCRVSCPSWGPRRAVSPLPFLNSQPTESVSRTRWLLLYLVMFWGGLFMLQYRKGTRPICAWCGSLLAPWQCRGRPLAASGCLHTRSLAPGSLLWISFIS